MCVRVVGIDWSGAKRGAGRKIWRASVEDGAVTGLASGLEGYALGRWLIEEGERDPNLVVGFDFAFSFPATFLKRLGVASAPELWLRAESDGEDWLSNCEPPFWGRPGKKRPEGELRDRFRLTEIEAREVTKIQAKSVFQIGGAGAVGTGSIRGMPVLRQLREAGFAVWPFDEPHGPFVVEIYPRLLSGAVNKSSAADRRAYLASHPSIEEPWRTRATDSEDAFDAVVSALSMWEHRDQLASLTKLPERAHEGAIWWPTATAYLDPALPKEPFVLVDERGDEDGPFLPEYAEVVNEPGAPTGTVVLASDGLPRYLRVVRRDGHWMTTVDGGGTARRVRLREVELNECPGAWDEARWERHRRHFRT